MSYERDLSSQFANSVLANYWDNIYPVDPIAISRRFGIKVIYDDLPQDISGALIKTEKMDFPVIMVDSSESDVRKRFTVAHELGHYLYNTFILKLNGVYEKIDYRGQSSKLGSDKEEIFANGFAAALLMPKDVILEKGNFLSQAQIFELASKLDVSLEALNYRLQYLGVHYG